MAFPGHSPCRFGYRCKATLNGPEWKSVSAGRGNSSNDISEMALLSYSIEMSVPLQ